MSFKPVNRVTKVINKDTVKDGYLYNENEYHISSKPIYYQNTAGSFHDIDITYSQSLNNSKVGDFVSISVITDCIARCNVRPERDISEIAFDKDPK